MLKVSRSPAVKTTRDQAAVGEGVAAQHVQDCAADASGVEDDFAVA